MRTSERCQGASASGSPCQTLRIRLALGPGGGWRLGIGLGRMLSFLGLGRHSSCTTRRESIHRLVLRALATALAARLGHQGRVLKTMATPVQGG
eukprot:4819517-Pyramimonas_sp.AAC.1